MSSGAQPAGQWGSHPPDPSGYIAAMQGEEGADRRRRLRRLDDCLNLLEQAHEYDLTHVTARIAEMVGERTPQIVEGMLIVDAIEEVLRQQEPYMVQMRPETPNRRVRRRREPFDIRVLLSRR